tara:strand:- start:1720 stop:1857 length:138 start_codon:yes stop_codon:yes gene_type:complete
MALTKTYTLNEQEALTALYKSIQFCEENNLPTAELNQALASIENK